MSLATLIDIPFPPHLCLILYGELRHFCCRISHKVSSMRFRSAVTSQP